MKTLSAILLKIFLLFLSASAFAQSGPWAKYDNTMKGNALVRESDGGNLEEVKSIVAGGGDVNWQLEPTGLSPLMAAASNGKTEVVRYLLNNGADPLLKDANGRTALDRAKMFGANDIVKLLNEFLKKSAPKPTPEPVQQNDTKPKPNPLVNNTPKAKGSLNWPLFGSYNVGDRVMVYAGSWKKGVIKEVGITDNKDKNAKPSEKKYLIALDAYPNWPDWMDWSVVVKDQREPFWTNWFLGDWKLGEVMAHTVKDEGTEELHTYSYYAATEALRVNADGTYQWKPEKNKEIKGNWKAAPDGPGIVLLKGYRGLDWTIRNESTATELHIRKVEKIRLFPSATVMSISGKRPSSL
jgi:hypothetical protein